MARRSVMAYETTSVSVERSQAEARKLLNGYGATGFAFGEETEQGVRWALLQFAHGGRRVRMRVPHNAVDDAAVRARARRSRGRGYQEVLDQAVEQEHRRIWRVIAHNLKARLVAVQEGVETFDEAFLAHLVTPTGRTVYEELADTGRLELAAPLAALTTTTDQS